MEDKDNLYFSFDEEGEEGGDEEEAGSEEGQNRTFLFAGIGLAAIVLLGICGAGIFLLTRQQAAPTGPSPNELTNNANIATASAAPPKPTQAPATTAAPAVSTATPTSAGVAVTVIGTGTPSGTLVAQVGTPGTQAAGGTPGLGAAAKSPTPGGPTPTKITSGIIEVTPLGPAGGLGGGVLVTPTRIGTGGPVQPTPGLGGGSLPTSGFGGGGELAGAGMLAVVLVVVAVIARRNRLSA